MVTLINFGNFQNRALDMKVDIASCLRILPTRGLLLGTFGRVYTTKIIQNNYINDRKRETTLPKGTLIRGGTAINFELNSQGYAY